MKQFIFLILVLVLAGACSTQSKNVKTNKKAQSISMVDTTEYEVETFNSRFEQWYVKYQEPSKYKSQSYYESWNQQYVTAWNAKCAREGKNFPFEPVVGYELNEDYGFEMNHKLFYYFMYVENVLKIKVLPGGPATY